jgi:uncharacterized protein
MSLWTLFFLCIAGFCAAFVDSIAGGGGMISIPAFIMAGVPPHLTLGTNKFSATTNSLTSSISYIRGKKVNWNFLAVLIPFAFIGAFLGVRTVIHIPQLYLNLLISFLILLVSIYTLLKKNLGQEHKVITLYARHWLFAIIFALSIGFYDGFFGPGTGSFLMFVFIKYFGMDFLHAAGNSRVLNFTSNAISLVLFAIHGKIWYAVGIPVAFAMFLGALAGSRLAFRKGVMVVRPLFIAISFFAAIKLIFDFIGYIR